MNIWQIALIPYKTNKPLQDQLSGHISNSTSASLIIFQQQRTTACFLFLAFAVILH